MGVGLAFVERLGVVHTSARLSGCPMTAHPGVGGDAGMDLMPPLRTIDVSRRPLGTIDEGRSRRLSRRVRRPLTGGTRH